MKENSIDNQELLLTKKKKLIGPIAAINES